MDNFNLEVSQVTMNFCEIIHGDDYMIMRANFMSDFVGDSHGFT